MSSLLNEKVLVLSANWNAIASITVRSALSLLFRERAAIVDTTTFQLFTIEQWLSKIPNHEARCLKSISARLEQPEVILLRYYKGKAQPRIAFSRNNLWVRDGSRCQYCGNRVRLDDSTIDHIIPRAQNGTTSWENCVIACSKCNSRKAGRTPEEARMHLLTTPVAPLWDINKEFPGKLAQIFGKQKI